MKGCGLGMVVLGVVVGGAGWLFHGIAMMWVPTRTEGPVFMMVVGGLLVIGGILTFRYQPEEERNAEDGEAEADEDTDEE